MAWVSLSTALERALKRLELDCAATAGTDADAEKMAAALGKQQPPSHQGETSVTSGGKAGDTNRDRMNPALPTGKCHHTARPERVSPPLAVWCHLTVVVDNGARGADGGGVRPPPSYRSAPRGKARETGFRIVV